MASSSFQWHLKHDKNRSDRFGRLRWFRGANPKLHSPPKGNVTWTWSISFLSLHIGHIYFIKHVYKHIICTCHKSYVIHYRVGAIVSYNMLWGCLIPVTAGKYGKWSTSSYEGIPVNIHCYSVPAGPKKNIYIYNGNPQPSFFGGLYTHYDPFFSGVET